MKLPDPASMSTKKPSLLSGVLRMFLRAMIGAYGMSVLLFLIVHVVIGESVMLVALFNSFAHWLLMPAVVLLPLCLLLREWRLTAMLLPAVVMFTLNYGQQFIPARVQPTPDAPVLRVLSYNVLGTERPMQEALNIIRESDADVVALQEISQSFETTLRESLADEYPYMDIHTVAGQATAGQGILSRYPLTNTVYWRADWLPLRLGHQRVTIQWDAITFALYNVHPVHPGMGEGFFDVTPRSREIDAILRRAAGETLPVMLVGDFNMSDLATDYYEVTSTYADAFRRSGFGMGFTFPVGYGAEWMPPFLRLDYIFYDATALRATHAAIFPTSGGSDHRPLIADLVPVSQGE